MFGLFNEFLYGAIWLALVIALSVTGWRAVHQGYFRAVSESYYGRKAQGLGGACLAIAVVAGLLFLQRLLQSVLFGLSGSGLLFILGAALGAYLTLRYYVHAV